MPWDLADVEQSVPQVFARQAASTPDRPAVAGGVLELTYAQLDALANGYAHQVLGLSGAGAGRVALLMADDAPLFAATLGVLKAGKTTVVLNPSDPPARLRLILEDARPELVLTDAEHADSALQAGVSPAQLVTIGVPSPPREVVEAPDVALDLAGIACLVYTSGSTGRPKGVIHTHRGLLGHIASLSHTLVRSGDRVPLLVSTSGTGGVTALWCSLLTGATVCPFVIAARGMTGLAEWAVAQRITVLNSYPSLFRHMVHVLEGQPVPPLRAVALGGEPVMPADFLACRRIFGAGCAFASALGSTETGLLAIHWIEELGGDPGALPVGRGVDTVELRLIDDEGREVGAGETGEITVRAEHLPAGYWDDEELTAARFYDSEWGRVLRTGDLAIAAADGVLTIVGRRDLQVKIRGSRISLEEIEGTIAALPGVTGAAVCTTHSRRDEPSLIAFLTTSAQDALTAAGVREALREVLPEREIPTAFVFLDTLPVTAQGKVDRARLAELAPSATAGEPSTSASDLSEAEEILAAIWSVALERDVTADDDFFQAGGDSLAAAVIAAQVHSRFAVRLDLRAIVENPTVGSLARVIAELQASPAGDGGPPLQRAPADEPAPMSFAQERTWRHSQTPERSAGHIDAVRLRIRGGLRADLLRRALERLFARHDAFRTSFRESHGRPVQVVSATCAVEVPLIELSREPDAEHRSAEMLAELASVPFDLERGPLLRLALLRISPEEHHLLWVDHHIATDAWSSRMFFEELHALYDAFERDAPPPLSEELPFQPRDFAAWERRRLDPCSTYSQSELAWWRSSLDDAPATLRLPFSREHAAPETDPAEGVIRWGLAADVSRGLERLGHEAAATFYMARLALLAGQLAIETGSEDLILGTYASGRSLPQTHAMFGFFSNMVTLRLRLDPELSFRALLEGVCTSVIEMSAHSEFPYELLRERLAGEGLALPEVGLIFNPGGSAPMPLGELDLTYMPRLYAAMPWGFTFSPNPADETACNVAFDARIHDPHAVREFLARYAQLAAEVCAEPERPLRELHLAGLR